MAAKKSNKGKKSIDCIITDCLYLGDAKISRDLNLLKSVGITHIICLAGKSMFESTFIYHMAHFKDKQDSDMLKLLPSIFEFIDNVIDQKKNNKIFIHCMAGMSRSPSIVMAYLMYKFNLTLKQSYIYVIDKRSCIRPNYIFLQQLWNYENILFGDKFEHSITSKELRNISGLYKKKWLKELKQNPINFDNINKETIVAKNKKADAADQESGNKDQIKKPTIGAQ